MSKPKMYDVLFAYGDRHAPHNDARLDAIVLDIIRDVKPDIIIDGGDFISADCLSDFKKAYHELAGLQRELDIDFSWRKQINALAPKAKKIVLQDNHFFRRLDRRKRDNTWTHELKAIQAENLLRLDETGWLLVKQWKWRDALIFIHGDDKTTDKYPTSSKNPVNKVRNLVKEYGISVVRFHSHVTGIEMYNQRNRVLYGIQLGTMEDVHDAGYLSHPDFVNWTTSMALLYLPKEGTDIIVVPIMVNNYRAIVNGRVYQG